MPLHLHVAANGNAAVVTFRASRLDETNADAIGKSLLHVTRELDRPQLRLDFAAVDTLTSTAVAKLVTVHRRVQELDGQLTLVNADPLVYQVLEVTGLTGLFNVRGAA